MSEQWESVRRQRPVAVITLLFGLLIGIAGGTGIQVRGETGAAQLTLGETLRRSAGLRIARSGQEQPEPGDPSALLPPPVQVVTELVSSRPAAAPVPFASVATPASRHVPYQARAPPAA